jgi:dUTP pyrophosphatase
MMWSLVRSALATCETCAMTTTAAPLKILVQRLHPSAQLPRYAHFGPFGDLAADLFAAEAATLAPAGRPGSTQLVRTGLAMELPSTHGALVEDRSGLAVRGITTLAGVIDPGYRGELKVVLTNLAAEEQMVAPGHRIAQLRIVERIQAVFEETDSLAETPRGEGGFGSTGQ